METQQFPVSFYSQATLPKNIALATIEISIAIVPLQRPHRSKNPLSFHLELKSKMTTTQTPVLPLFQAFADPYRVQVVELLRHQELCACDIAEHLGITASKLSFHLKALKEAGIVQGRQEGRWIYYRLNLQPFLALEQYFSEFRRYSPVLPARNCPD